MLPIITSPKARKDIKAFFHHISKDDLTIAYRLLDRVKNTHELICNSPKMGQNFKTTNPKLLGMRWFPVKDFPKHLIFYIESSTQITIVRVLHKAQDISNILT